MKSLGRMLIAKRRWGLVGAATLSVFAELASPALLALSGMLIVFASEQIPIMLLTTQIVGVRAMAFLRAGGNYAERLVTHDTAFAALSDLRVSVWLRLIPLVPQRLSAVGEGELLAATSRDVDDVRDGLLAGLIPFIAVPVAALIVAVAGLLTDSVAGFTLSLGMVGALVIGVGVAILQPSDDVAARTALHATTVDVIQGKEELLMYGAIPKAMQTVDEAGKAAAIRDRNLAITRGLTSAFAMLIGAVSTIAVAAILGDRISAGIVDKHAMAPIVLMSLGAFEMIGQLGPAILRLRVANRALSRLEETLSAPVDIIPDDVVFATKPVTSIGLHDISLPHTKIQRLNLTINQGEIIGISGPSGIGKTTLLRVLTGLVAPSTGYITADGKEVAHVRDVIAVASQDAHLLPTTIRTNIAIGGPHSVSEAAALAQLGDWLGTLPDGLDTHVGVGMLTVSGGQQRRIALARALASERPFIALDEPSAELDEQTAEAFMNACIKAATIAQKTVLFISHDPNVLRFADRVVDLAEYGEAPPHPEESL